MANVTFPGTNIINFSLVSACIDAAKTYDEEKYNSWRNQAEYYQPYNPSFSKTFAREMLERTHTYSEVVEIASEWETKYQKFRVRRGLFLLEVAHALGTKIYLDNEKSWLAYYMSSDNTIHLRPDNFCSSIIQHELIHAMQYQLGILKVEEFPKEIHWEEFEGTVDEKFRKQKEDLNQKWEDYYSNNSLINLPTEFLHLGINRFLKFFDTDNWGKNNYKTNNATLEVAAFGLEDNYYIFDDIVEKHLNFTEDRLLRKHYLLSKPEETFVEEDDLLTLVGDPSQLKEEDTFGRVTEAMDFELWLSTH